MNLRHITPVWARRLIIPTVICLYAFSVYLTYIFLRAYSQEGEWILVPLGFPIVWLFFYTSYRGHDLVRSRNIRAAVQDQRLHVQADSASEPIAYELASLKVVDRPWMKITEIVSIDSNKKILSVDHYFPNGMELIGIVKQQQGEQDAEPNRIAAPSD